VKPLKGFTLPTVKRLMRVFERTLRSPLFANNLDGLELRVPSGGLRVSRLAREWRNGRRAGLRIRCRKAWGFKSPLSQSNKVRLARARNAGCGHCEWRPAAEIGQEFGLRRAVQRANLPGANDQERFGSLSASRSLIHCSIDSWLKRQSEPNLKAGMLRFFKRR
jgi:hypothetical protein